MTDQATVEPAASGLLDNVQVEDKSQAANPQAADISHKADGQAVDTGAPKAKPEYLPNNFWDSEKGEANYEAMAKSWTDLRKTISQGKHKAPEDGEYDTSVLAEGVDASALTDYAKKWGLSQAAFEELASQTKQLAEQAAGPAIDSAAEMKQLGPNAPSLKIRLHRQRRQMQPARHGPLVGIGEGDVRHNGSGLDADPLVQHFTVFMQIFK